jgi:Pectate lyase superfamily protein
MAVALLAISYSLTPGFSQQPQAPTGTPLYSVNAEYVNGMAPGYWPTGGTGLVLNLSAGTAYCGNPPVPASYPGGSLALTASATNYIYLDPANNCSPAAGTSAFTAGEIPIATVVTGTSSITSITDARTWFTPQPCVTGSAGDLHCSSLGTNQNISLNTSGSGATVITNLLDKGGQAFNVKAYGAKGDGTADDTAAFQNAESGAHTATGGIIFVPPGTYKLTASLSLQAGDQMLCVPKVNLVDAPPTDKGGAILNFTGLGSTTDGIDILGNHNNVKIVGCTLNMNSSGQYGIYASGSSNDTFENVTIIDPVGDGFRLDSGPSSGYHSYDDYLHQVMVIHSASGVGFDFRTDAGGGDMDRITCIDCKYHSADPGSGTESGTSSFALVTGTGTGNNIADMNFTAIHAGGAAVTGSESIFQVTQTGSAVVANLHINGELEHNFYAGNSGTGLDISTTSALGVQGLFVRGLFAHFTTDYNVSTSNATGFSIYDQENQDWYSDIFPFKSGTCTMSSGTTCSPPNTIRHGTHCSATVQGSTPIAGACSISGTTLTVTASSSNSDTWAWQITN